MSKYNIEVDSDMIDKFVRDRLLSDYDMVVKDISSLEFREDMLQDYQRIDLADMRRWRNHLKGVLEFYMIPSEYKQKFL
jgi:hypothetical protein